MLFFRRERCRQQDSGAKPRAEPTPAPQRLQQVYRLALPTMSFEAILVQSKSCRAVDKIYALNNLSLSGYCDTGNVLGRASPCPFRSRTGPVASWTSGPGAVAIYQKALESGPIRSRPRSCCFSRKPYTESSLLLGTRIRARSGPVRSRPGPMAKWVSGRGAVTIYQKNS